MKSIIITTAIILFFNSVSAQSSSIPVEKIQKLLVNTEGQNYVNVMGNKEKITKQTITLNSYTFYYTGLGKNGSNWRNESKNIQWDKGFTYFSMVASGNDKLTKITFKFENELDWSMYLEGKDEAASKNTRNSLEFYILTADFDEFKTLIKK